MVTNPKLLLSHQFSVLGGGGCIALNLIQVRVTETSGVSVTSVSVGVRVTVVSAQTLGAAVDVAAGSMAVVAIVSISGGFGLRFGLRFGLSFTLVETGISVSSIGGVTVTGITVVAVVSGSITVISGTIETMSVSVSTAVVAIVSIGGGFSLRFGISFSLTFVDLRDTVAGSGGVYALERGSSGDGIILGSISIGKGSIGSKELRFGISFGLTLVVSVSVSAVGVSTVVSTVVSTIVSTLTKLSITNLL